MTFFQTPMTVAELRTALSNLPDNAPIHVHGSNGWGPGAPRALYKLERDRRGGVHLYGAFL